MKPVAMLGQGQGGGFSEATLNCMLRAQSPCPVRVACARGGGKASVSLLKITGGSQAPVECCCSSGSHLTLTD